MRSSLPPPQCGPHRLQRRHGQARHRGDHQRGGGESRRDGGDRREQRDGRGDVGGKGKEGEGQRVGSTLDPGVDKEGAGRERGWEGEEVRRADPTRERKRIEGAEKGGGGGEGGEGDIHPACFHHSGAGFRVANVSHVCASVLHP